MLNHRIDRLPPRNLHQKTLFLLRKKRYTHAHKRRTQSPHSARIVMRPKASKESRPAFPFKLTMQKLATAAENIRPPSFKPGTFWYTSNEPSSSGSSISLRPNTRKYEYASGARSFLFRTFSQSGDAKINALRCKFELRRVVSVHFDKLSRDGELALNVRVVVEKLQFFCSLWNWIILRL